MRRFLYDTNVFVYALGGPSAHREPCRRVLSMAEGGQLRGEACVELVQEFAHQRHRQTRQRDAAARGAERIARACILHPLEAEDLPLALRLFAATPGLHCRDACFAAVALNRGIDVILSADRAFDAVGGLQRVDPVDEAAVAALSYT